MSATGAKSFLMLGLEQQLDGYNCGAPRPLTLAVAAPDPPTSSAGASGLVTGTVIYKRALIILGRGETLPSTASAPLTVTTKHVTIAADAPAAGLNVQGQIIYRSADSGTTWEAVLYQWDDLAIVAGDDNVPVGSGDVRTPKAADETAANWGLVQFPVDPTKVLERADGEIVTNELTGDLGMPRALPGAVTIPLDVSMSARASALVAVHATMFGKPAVVQTASEPTLVHTFPLSDDPADSVSLWGLYHQGLPLRPMLYHGLKVNELEYKATSATELGVAFKGRGIGDSETAPGKTKTIAGTSEYGPVIHGLRSDANRYTHSVFVKVTAGPSAGTMGIKVATAAAGGTPTYTGAEHTIYYDTTTKLQIQGGTNDEAWAELFTVAGLALGYDDYEHREPVSIYFPGDVTKYAATDEWELVANQLIPGVVVGSAAYSGSTRRMIGLERFTPAQVSILRGTSSADTLLTFQALGVKLSRTLSENRQMSQSARRPMDLDVTGYAGVELTLDRRFDSREFQRICKENSRLFVEIRFRGARIPIGLGALSTSRESIVYTLPQVRVKNSDTPLSGPGISMEKLVLSAEQPDDGSQAITPVITTAYSWDFDSI